MTTMHQILQQTVRGQTVQVTVTVRDFLKMPSIMSKKILLDLLEPVIIPITSPCSTW